MGGFSSLGILQAILRSCRVIRVALWCNVGVKNLNVIVTVLNITSQRHLTSRVSETLLLHRPFTPIEGVHSIWSYIIAVRRESWEPVVRVRISALWSIHLLL